MKIKQERLLKSYKIDFKNIKIQQFSIPAKKAGATFSFSPITEEEPKTAVQDPKTQEMSLRYKGIIILSQRQQRVVGQINHKKVK